MRKIVSFQKPKPEASPLSADSRAVAVTPKTPNPALHTPLISIITVTFNAEAVLEKTVQSIVGQKFADYEYIIIDGGSTDGTLGIIRKHEHRISHWVSEPDAGLYDAMNKGLQAARGKYVWFMNAGDLIHDARTLAHIFNDCPPDADIYYGDALFFDGSGRNLGLRSEVTPHQLPPALTWRDFRCGMVVCHQSFIVKRSLAPPYNLAHRYSADVDWEINCLKNARKIVHTQAVLSQYLTGGFSKKNLSKSLLDRFLVLQRHFGAVPNLFNHAWIALRGMGFILNRKRGY